MSGWFRSYGFADVYEGLLIGAYPLDSSDVAMLKMARIDRVMNLVQDSEYRPGQRAQVEAALAREGIEEHRLDLVDYGGLPPEALEAAVHEVNKWLDDGERTYLHCRAGWQRSAAVAAGVVAVRSGCRHRASARLRSKPETLGRSVAAPAGGSPALVGAAWELGVMALVLSRWRLVCAPAPA